MANATPAGYAGGRYRSAMACFTKCRWCGCDVQRENIYSDQWYHRALTTNGPSAIVRVPCLASDLSEHFVRLTVTAHEAARAYKEDRHMDGAPIQHLFGERQRTADELVAWCIENVEFVVRNG